MFRPHFIADAVRKDVTPRRGVILMVVLILLTLFAIVGVSFALYTGAEAGASLVYRESQVSTRADAEPELLASFFLGQMIYDTDDLNGIYSALRGHSLARSMYGAYYARQGDPDIPNTVPFNGLGRLHTHQATAAGDPLAFMNPFKMDDYLLINYTFYPNDLYPSSTGSTGPSLAIAPFLRDPERTNPNAVGPVPWRTNPSQPPGPFVGGFNAPYTYPDLNNMFLAAVKADGTLLTPSYHRPWLFGPLVPPDVNPNPNWFNSVGKYLTLRPRPIDQITQAQATAAGLPWPLRLDTLNPAQQTVLNNLVKTLQSQGQLFPYPEDATGDVKNLVGAPGGNDSIWIDLDYPVLTAPNGQKFKPMFGALILDLDNRINLNVHGNIRGGTPGNRYFVSNQGWGPWTVDVSQILNYGIRATPSGTTAAPAEWEQLYYGLSLVPKDPNETRVPPVQPGRYGVNTVPIGRDTNGMPITSDQSWTTTPHKYAPVDYDEFDATGKQPTPPVALANGINCFPKYPVTGFDNYVGERDYHPSLYNVSQPTPDQRRFPLSDMEALLRFGDTGSPFLTSELLRLCPQNFGPGGDQRRRLVTLRSFDVERPGAAPWLTQFHGAYKTQGNFSLPYGGASTFTLPSPVPQDPNDFRIARVGTTNQFATDYRSAMAALGRLDLNRPLPPYPTPANGVINDNDLTILRKFQAAEFARQQLAEDIYQRLISVTGAFNPFLDPVANPNAFDAKTDVPTLQALAQLAVNIVDFIDEDEYSTPFHWGAIGHPNFVRLVENQSQPAAQQTPQWVFGVEMPHVLINEAYAQFSIDNDNKMGAQHNTKVEVWAELYNPLSPDPTFPFNGDVHLSSGMGPTRGYRLLLARPWTLTPTPGNGTDSYIRNPSNPRGTPRRYSAAGGQDMGVYQTNPTQPQYAIVDFVTGGSGPSATLPVVKASGGGPGPQGYYVVGPANTQGPAMPAGSPVDIRSQMTYTLSDTDRDLVNTSGNTGAPLYRPAPPTIVLQRLACPYRPHNPLPNDPEFPGGYNSGAPVNPYITIDYFSDVNTQPQIPQGKSIFIANSNKKPVTGNGAQSEGRRQPFAGNGLQKVKQTSGTDPKHSFFSKNDNIQPNFDWLVHLDRQLISPMELLHVAAVKPALLTQEFIDPPGPGSTGRMLPFNHRVAWYDEDLPATTNDSHRLYRLFDYVATRSRAAGLEAPVTVGQVVPNTKNQQIRPQRLSWMTPSGVPAAIKAGDVLVIDKGVPDSHENVRVQSIIPSLQSGGGFAIQLVSPGLLKPHGNTLTIELTTMGERVPGKININTIFDFPSPTFQALANPTVSNNYATADIFNPSNGQGVFTDLLRQRTPGLFQTPPQLSGNDLPFVGMAAGQYSGPVPFYGSDPTKYGTSGVNHTLLAAAQAGGNPTSKRLMQVPLNTGGAPQHPFIANQLLTKLFNNVTTRSNVFAVWLTVGFFEVLDDTVRPVKLGAEIGKAENRNIRHRMFAIVDRTALTVPSVIGSLRGAITTPGLQGVQLDKISNQIPIGPVPPIGPIDPTIGRAASQIMSWTLQPGDVVVVGEGTANQETVTISSVDVQKSVVTAQFSRPHGPLETVSIRVVPGNPGPVARFNPRDRIYEEVVPYLSIID